MTMTKSRLREIYGNISPRAAAKVIHHFDHHCRDFIAASPFLMIATSDGTSLDVSPKGDPAGFVKILDDKTLILPDRPGNNRLDGLMNLIDHPQVALIFMIPSVDETLRVNGRAVISEDQGLRDICAINGRLPTTVLKITADEIYCHCGKSGMRAGLWNPNTWPIDRPVATLYEIVRDHAEMDVDYIDQDSIEAGYKRTLY